MKKLLVLSLVCLGVAVMGHSTEARADLRVSINLGPSVRHYPAYPVYPVYRHPAPVYYQPYCPPAPVVYARPYHRNRAVVVHRRPVVVYQSYPVTACR
ncbi:MAG: hypothetical protein HC904_07655 [Blastochloris sp.]|nr:hypothetical protein [Blastochloris sp.]